MKKALLFCFLFIQMGHLFAFEVAVEEVNKAKNHEAITFQSFTGTHAENDTADQIYGLGRTLGRMCQQENYNYVLNNKYGIIEITNKENDGLYSAAIISILPSAHVDHIRNVRKIIAGYLIQKFHYSVDEANTLAFFLTFYNAIYRGNIDYLRTVYKPEVFQFVNKSNVGISTNYKDWPGNTCLIIPLTENNKVSLSQLGQETITKAKSTNDDNAIEQREKLQTLKTQQLDEKRQEQTQKKEKEQILKQELAKKQQETKTAEKTAQNKQKEADRLTKEAQTAVEQSDPDAQKKVEEAQAAQKEADEVGLILDEKRKSEAKTQQELLRLVGENEQNQQEIDKLSSDTEQERKQLATDKAIQHEKEQEKKRQAETKKMTLEAQKNPGKVAEELVQAREELANKPAGPVVADKFFHINVNPRTSNGHYNNRICAIDASTGNVTASSETNICSANFSIYGDGLLAVTARDPEHAGAHNLSILSLETLKVVKTSSPDVDVHYNSPVVMNDEKIYALIVQDKKVYLARFNKDLELEAQTIDSVDTDTIITVYKDRIYANTPSKNAIAVFDKKSLETINRIFM